MKSLHTTGKAICFIAIFGALILVGATATAATYYVDGGRPDDSGDGLSWAMAKKTVQAAVDVAPGAPDQIWVKGGTYTETITMESGVALYGGFAGTETLLTERNVVTNLTILNASTLATRYHVVTMDSLVNARFDGFTVTGGNANGTAPNNVGGGIYCNNLNNTNEITNFIVTLNNASDGGGMYCGAGSSPVISNGLFLINTMTALLQGGAGLHCDASSPTFSVCVFAGNIAAFNGGGIGCSSGASPTFTNCLMGTNAAMLGGGGAIWCWGGATPSFTNCVISGNNCAGRGGAAYCQSAATFTNCLISGNQAAGAAGGGAISVNRCSPTFVNCTVASNVCTNASGHGGGIACTGTAGNHSNPILNNTIFENNGQYAVYEADVNSDPVVTYCLFFNNADGDYYDEGSTLRNGAAAINGIAGNSNNVDTDPVFYMNGPQAITGTWTEAPTYANAITTLTAAAANYVPNALFGRLINADTTQRRQAYIVGNTATQIYVLTDVTSYAGLGDTYRLVDYHLGYGSGAIDYATSLGAPANDLESNSRPVDIPGVGGVGLTFDIGAYEAPLIAYADTGRPDDSGDGLSWATAKKTIQAAIDLSAAAHQVWVKQGTYPATVTLRTGTSLYGGFAGTESLLTQRNVAANVTIINAGTASPRYHAVTMDGITSASIDGFTITGGLANGTGNDALGAGIYANNLDSTNTISTCTLVANVGGAGSAISCNAASSPTISNCTLIANTVATGGTLLCNGGSNPSITGCLIAYNLATGTNAAGGGIWCTSSSPTISNCRICQNTATSANVGGGGLGCSGGSPVLTNCVISGNLTDRNGGGVLCLAASAPTLTNCIISGNAALNGGAVYCDASAPVLMNCTVADDSASGSGGGVYCANASNPTFKNTLFDGDKVQAVYEADANSDPVVSFCLFNNNPDGDYFDEGTTLVSGAAAINALPGNSSNVGGDPKFVMNGLSSIAGTWTNPPTYNPSTLRTTLTNSAASLTPGALAGMSINPDTSQNRQVMIVTNTATQIEVVGDVTSFVASGDAYRVIDYHLWDLSAAVDTGGDGGGERIHALQLEMGTFGEVFADAADEVHGGGIVPVKSVSTSQASIALRSHSRRGGSPVSSTASKRQGGAD